MDNLDELIFLTEPQSSTETLEKRYFKLMYDLIEDEKYRFSMLLNRGWKTEDIKPKRPDYEINQRSIAVFKNNASPPAHIEVLAALTPREVNPSDWLQLWLQKNNAYIANGRYFNTEAGTVADLLAVVQNDTADAVWRALCIKDGNRLFTVVCKAPRKNYNQFAEDFLLALSSFTLTKPSGKIFAEKMSTIETDYPLKTTFFFPASWEKRADKSNSSKIHTLSFYNTREETVVGVFTFSAVLKSLEPDRDNFFKNYVANFEENGFKAQNQLNMVNSESGNGIFEAQVLLLDKKNNEFEINATLYEGPDSMVLFAIMSFVDAENYDIHIINKRAHEIALKTFKLQ